MAPNSFAVQIRRSFKTGPTNFSIFTMNIVLNVIIQHGCKCRMFFSYTFWGGNYFFEITVSSFVYLQCNWRSEIYHSVTHYAVTTSCMEKRGIVDKKFSYFLKTLHTLDFLCFLQQNKMLFSFLTLQVNLISTNSVYHRCSHSFS